MTTRFEGAMYSPPQQEHHRSTEGPVSFGAPCGMIIAILWLLTTPALLRNLIAVKFHEPPAPIIAGVDPNAAPWWELTVLPEVGEGTAREVVRYRTALLESRNRDGVAGPAFRSAADLDQVKGIGPVTILRMGPYLRFDGGGPQVAPRLSSDPP